MRIVETYSHLFGLEGLTVHKPKLWQEVQDVIANVDAESCKTKVSKERNRQGDMLYSPSAMNKAFSVEFRQNGWQPSRNRFYVTNDKSLMQQIWRLPHDEQKRIIEEHGQEPIGSYNQTDFVKDGISIEVQFGKYAFVAHDIFVKHMSFVTSGVIEIGIEIVPMKELERQMSSGVPYYERDLLNIIRQGHGVPNFPLILIGVAP